MGEFRFPTMAINGDRNCRRTGMRRSNSAVLPLLEIRILGSPGV